MNSNSMEETLGYGLDTGLYESFLDGLEKNYNVENVNSLVVTEEDPSCHGLFTELGFSEGEAGLWNLEKENLPRLQPLSLTRTPPKPGVKPCPSHQVHCWGSFHQATLLEMCVLHKDPLGTRGTG